MMKSTISVREAAKLLGISPSSAYKSVHAGTFPTQVIQIGQRYVVPTKPLLDLLDLDELPPAA
ncbi:helix-turn-helix transcriptional regulator [Corynebacterium sp. S7]